MPERKQDSHKGTFGKVLNFSGSKNYIGASYLSTLAILKSGAGFTALASEKDIIKAVSSMLPEAVYLSRKEGLKNIKDFSVILFGCGIGLERKSYNLFKKVVKNAGKTPFILDADGLNILSKTNILLPENSVITPHPLEASRLLGISVEDILKNQEESARKLSEKYNCTAVLKTHRTVICKKDKIFVNQHGNSALAKAGSGDVLAGIISGLAAQNVDLYEASKLGVYLHSAAGEIASAHLTEYSVLASEIVKYLPDAVKTLL